MRQQQSLSFSLPLSLSSMPIALCCLSIFWKSCCFHSAVKKQTSNMHPPPPPLSHCSSHLIALTSFAEFCCRKTKHLKMKHSESYCRLQLSFWKLSTPSTPVVLGKKGNRAVRKRGGARLHYRTTHTHTHHQTNWWRGFFFLLLLSSPSANESALPGNTAVGADLSASELSQGNSCLGRYQPGAIVLPLMTFASGWWAKVQRIDLIFFFFQLIYLPIASEIKPAFSCHFLHWK